MSIKTADKWVFPVIGGVVVIMRQEIPELLIDLRKDRDILEGVLKGEIPASGIELSEIAQMFFGESVDPTATGILLSKLEEIIATLEQRGG